MMIQNLSKEEVFHDLSSSENGLSNEEVTKRLLKYGLNQIKETRKTNIYKLFLSQFTNLFAILLWLAIALCFLSDHFHPEEGLFHLGIAIFVVLIVNSIFSFIQVYRAEKTIQALKKLLPSTVNVIREGAIEEIRSENIVPGDLLLLKEGDKVPADARLIEANNLIINDAVLTGESESKSLNHIPFFGDYLKSPNMVFAGTFIESGVGKAIVFSSGMDTELGEIAHQTKEVEERISPIEKEISRVSKIVALIAFTTGIIFFLLGFFIGRSFWQNFLFAIGIIIANIPEGLLPLVSLSLAIGCKRMAKKKALIKNLSSVESLGSVTLIFTDKTGTLTLNQMKVKEIWPFQSQIRKSTLPQKSKALSLLLKIANLCNNARLENGIFKGDGTEIALLKATKELVQGLKSKRLFEIPFNSERKMMSTVNELDKKKILLTKGALEAVLPYCQNILIDEIVSPLTEMEKESIFEKYHSMTDEGLRVISFAYKEINFQAEAIELNKSFLETSLTFVGLIGIEDPPRPEVPDAIKRCREAGIKVLMITGDSGRTALATGKQIGLVKNKATVIEGEELEKISDQELVEKYHSEELIFARMTPLHKMRLVSIFENYGERVAVTGDGVNDAPALKKAQVGIAMGATGTDVAREAADIVLLDDNFASIINAIEEGRSIFDNIKKFITYVFTSNIPEIIPYILYVILNIPLPLTIMQMLAIDLGTDIFPALALGAEKPSKNIMKQPPRNPRERLLNFKILSRAYLFLGPIEAIAGLFGFFYVLYSGGWIWGQAPNTLLYQEATSACLAGIIITQIGNVFTCRSSAESIFSQDLFSNKLIFAGILCEILIALFVIYSPLGNNIFNTSPIGLKQILILVPFAIGLLFSDEMRKYFAKKIRAK